MLEVGLDAGFTPSSPQLCVPGAATLSILSLAWPPTNYADPNHLRHVRGNIYMTESGMSSGLASNLSHRPCLESI